jgi:hypothetical protein
MMQKRNYEDLRKRFKDREELAHSLDVNENQVNNLRALFGVDFNDLRTRLPSEEELVQIMDTNTGIKGHSKNITFVNPKAVLETAIDMLLESFDKSAEKKSRCSKILWN